MKKLILSILCCLTACLVSAQDNSFSFFNSLEGDAADDQPTKITADAMDIDIANDLATFTGNVYVDDPRMTIACHKMIIHLGDTGEPKDGDKAGSNLSIRKTVSSIECVGGVVITRKLSDADMIAAGEQKATAGKAVYHLDSGEIVLTENPVLMRGKDSLSGKTITIWRDSNRMKVEGGGAIEMRKPMNASEEDE